MAVLQLRDFRALATRLDRYELELRAAETYARGAMAAHLEREVKAKIGDPAALPPPLAESTQEQRVRKGFSADETLLMTGALKRSITWAHTSPSTSVVGSLHPVAPYHEFGGSIPGRPPRRSFLASTVQEKNRELQATYVMALALKMTGAFIDLPAPQETT